MLGNFTFCRVIRRFRCYFYLQIYILCILYGMHGSLLSASCVGNYYHPCIISVNVIFYAFSLVVHRHVHAVQLMCCRPKIDLLIFSLVNNNSDVRAYTTSLGVTAFTTVQLDSCFLSVVSICLKSQEYVAGSIAITDRDGNLILQLL